MKTSQRIGVLLAALLLGGLFAGGASAALKKYDLKSRIQVNDPDVSPNPNTGVPAVYREESVVLIDSAGGPNPVLRKMVTALAQTNTTNVPTLAISIFVSTRVREGPGVLQQIAGNPAPAFTGTGNTTAGATTRWGTVTGWTLSGSTWCNSSPAVVCSLAMLLNESTVDGRFNSEFYDLGTWIFHGTGFTATPFLRSYSTNSVGNTTFFMRGPLSPDGTVPALPFLGIATLGASLVAGGVAALNRRRKP